MKTSTLLKIAADLEFALGVESRCSVNEMADRVTRCAGHCRTKADAAATLGRELYGFPPEDWESAANVVRSYA